MDAPTQLAKEANDLGKKLWAKALRSICGYRILTARQFSNLSADEQSIVQSGWMSWAYGEFGIDATPNSLGQRFLVKKDGKENPCSSPI